MLWVQAWLLTTLGGAACGLVGLGFISIRLSVLTVPVGAMTGAVLGLPLGFVLAVVVTGWATPPPDPVRFVRWVEAVGVVVPASYTVRLDLALLGGGSPFTAAIGDGAPIPLGALIPLGNSLAALVGVALIGRSCGRALAVLHLRRFGLGSSPPSRCRIGTAGS